MGIFNNKSDIDLIINNQEIYNYYRDRLINMALSQFIWENLPETCDRLYFERKLLFNGAASMLQPTGSEEWLSLGYVTQGTLNIYGYPTKIKGVGYNTANVDTDEFMILYDNMTKKSLIPYIDLYARLLWECHMTFRSNMQMQNKPYIVTGTKFQELSYKNIFNKIFNFQPYLLMKKKEDMEAIDVLDLKVPFYGKELLECLKVIWSEAVTMLGICPAGGHEKRERMNVEEVEFNREEYTVARNARELNRKEFCIKMNDKYGNLSPKGPLGVHMASVDLELPLDMAAAELDMLNMAMPGRKRRRVLDE